MVKPFETLRLEMAPEHQVRSAERTVLMREQLPLDRLREARRLAQETLATALGTKRSSITKLERRADLYLSTLRSYVEAMGGVLEIRASFAEGEVRVPRLGDIGDADGDIMSEARLGRKSRPSQGMRCGGLRRTRMSHGGSPSATWADAVNPSVSIPSICIAGWSSATAISTVTVGCLA